MHVLIAAASGVARALYAVLKTVLPQRRKVVFLSRQSDVPSRDFLLLAGELQRRDPCLEIVVRCRMMGTGLAGRLMSVIEVAAQMYHLATATVCVVDGYVVAVSILDHREGLFVIQMWHALGAIKRFGYQTVGRAAGRAAALASAARMHRNYDLVLCGGEATVPVFAAAFAVDPGIVQPLGLPRVDFLLEHREDARLDPPPAAVADLRRRFPVLADAGRTKVLYAPTFRKVGGCAYAEVVEAFGGDGFALLVKSHPLETSHVTGANVADVGDRDVLDILPMCDVVITDYSAVAFEALVLDTPIYFYVPDIDRYREDNGFNIDPLSDLPGISSRDIGDIVGWVAAGSTGQEAARGLKSAYMSSAAGGCTARIADVIGQHLGAAPVEAGAR